MNEAGSPVDLERVRLTSDGDKEFERELFDLFIEDCGQRIEILNKAITEKDAPSLSHEAHTIKGAAANIGAINVRDISLLLEKYDSSGGWDGANDLAARLREAFEDVRVFMTDYFAS